MGPRPGHAAPRGRCSGDAATPEPASRHHTAVEAALAELAGDRDHGATDLARKALDVLDLAASTCPAADLGTYVGHVGELIVLARPTMASVKNAVARAVARGPLAHRDHAWQAIGRVRAWLDHAAKTTVDEAARMLPDNATVVTCSYSNTVLEACVGAAAAGKLLRVIALHSKTGEIAYGERMVASLAARGIAATVYPDDVRVSDLRPLTVALIGADRVNPNGSLVNGTPSLRLAEQIRDVAPLYAAAETFKLDDCEQLEEGFDIVPASLITGYVTDHGVVQPSRVWGLRGETGSQESLP